MSTNNYFIYNFSKDEVNVLRGTPHDETLFEAKEDESAYGGSISGRSSMVSTLER